MSMQSYKGKRRAKRRRDRQTVCGIMLMLFGVSLIIGAYLYVPPVIEDRPSLTAPGKALVWTLNNAGEYAKLKWGQALGQSEPELEYEKPFFVGNSLIEGMRLNSDDGYPFCCKVGISLKQLNDTLGKPTEYDCAIIEMGSNELGVYDSDEFVNEYIALIQTLDCPCFCLSIPPVNEGKSKYAARVNNKNVERYNDYIQEVCERTGAEYIDCTPFFGETLDSDWTHDGLHLGPSHYADWYCWVLEQIPIHPEEGVQVYG